MPRTGMSGGEGPARPRLLSFALLALAFSVFAASGSLAQATSLPEAALDPRISTHLSAALRWASATDRIGDFGPLAVRADLEVPGLRYDRATPTEDVLLLIEGDIDPVAVEAAGARVSTRAGSVSTVLARLERVPALLALPGVRSIELEQPVELSTDVSRLAVNADVLQGGSPPSYPSDGLTGSGVVVGIVDSGLDTNHPDFRTSSGTRVVAYWDQSATVGTPPSGFSYGDAFGAAEINSGTKLGRDEVGHGTHVAGVAAGNGRGTGNGQPIYQYTGIAPEADLVIVKLRPNLNGSYTDARIIDGVNYVFQRAAALGKPAVVLVAATKSTGPRDGSDPMDTALTALTGPGRILVTAAGNNYGKSIHAEWTTIMLGATGTMTVNVPTYSGEGTIYDHFYIEAWYPGNGDTDFELISPSGWSSGVIPRGQQLTTQGPDGVVVIRNGLATAASGAVKVDIQVYRGSLAYSKVRSGAWTIRGTSQVSAITRTDAWITSTAFPSGLATFVQGKTDARLIGSPATADGAICATAYTTKRTWTDLNGNSWSYYYAQMNQIANYASSGPRRDGAHIPHIAAPGYGVAAALSSNYMASSSQVLQDGVHCMANGTSVAAAHVAGGVALLLQQSEALTREMLINQLQATADQDTYTGPVPNFRWGFGKLSLERLGTAGIAEDQRLAHPLGFVASPNPSRGPTTFRFDVPARTAGSLTLADIQIVDVAGREVARLRRDVGPGAEFLIWDGRTKVGTETVPGVYWARIQLQDGPSAVTRLIRLP